jgi:nucleoside-diphosphate-sugar epimerase
VRIFVAGATGVIGSALVPMLVKRGHTVVGMTRRPERAAWVSRVGAEACVCDVYDRERLGAAVTDARPDVVIHQLTALPQRYDVRRRDVTVATDRIRRDGTANLVAAARAAGCERVIAQSVALLYRPDAPGAVRTEADPPFLDAPEPFGATVAALLDLERQVLEAGGVVLRYGWLYGPGTWFAPDGYFSAEVRRRRYPIVGSGEGLWSFVHVADAASAAIQAAESIASGAGTAGAAGAGTAGAAGAGTAGAAGAGTAGAAGAGTAGAPGGIFNIVDDDPAPMRDWLPALARTLGARPPWRVPRWVARLAAGRVAAVMATRMPGASNAKARDELGWSPRYPTWRDRLGRSD